VEVSLRALEPSLSRDNFRALEFFCGKGTGPYCIPMCIHILCIIMRVQCRACGVNHGPCRLCGYRSVLPGTPLGMDLCWYEVACRFHSTHKTVMVKLSVFSCVLRRGGARPVLGLARAIARAAR
jgi:hypothetical protein